MRPSESRAAHCGARDFSRASRCSISSGEVDGFSLRQALVAVGVRHMCAGTLGNIGTVSRLTERSFCTSGTLNQEAPAILRESTFCATRRPGASAWPPRAPVLHCYDASMRLRDAIDMLADSGAEALGPSIWADLGCGDGTFTLALADLLAPGSIIHAMDLDGSALRSMPSTNKGVGIITHRGDFLKQPWPFADLDGILMANSLHYVEQQAVFIRNCESQMKPQRRFLVVEYDTSAANRWGP